MTGAVEISRVVPDAAFRALQAHLPYSLPLFRRLQFMNLPSGRTPDSSILTAFHEQEAFTVTYLDFSRGPEAELWLYSSLENEQIVDETSICEGQILSLLSIVRQLEQKYSISQKRLTPGVVLIGSLHSPDCISPPEARPGKRTHGIPFKVYISCR